MEITKKEIFRGNNNTILNNSCLLIKLFVGHFALKIIS